MKVAYISIKEQNEFANYAKSTNGGGYSQPEYEIIFDNRWKLIVSDTSCGEFGTRYSATLFSPSGKTFASAVWGTMEQYEYSSFLLEDYHMIIRALEDANVSIPWFDASLCVEYRLPTYKVWHKPTSSICTFRDPNTRFDKVQSITFGQYANEIFSEVSLIAHIREMLNYTIEEDFDIDFDD